MSTVSPSFFARLLQLLFARKEVNSSANSVKPRRIVMERLEDRQLLSVSPLLPGNMAAFYSAAENNSFSVVDTTTASLREVLSQEETVETGHSYSFGGSSITLEENLPEVGDLAEPSSLEFNGLYLTLEDELGSDSEATLLEESGSSPVYGPITYPQYLNSLSDRQQNGTMSMSCGCGSGCGCGGGSGCGCSSGCGTPDVYFVQLTSCNTSETVYAYDSGCCSLSQELFVFQDGCTASASVFPAMSATTGCTGKTFITVNNPGGQYWTSSSGSFTWHKPATMTNAQAKRDFTVTFMVYTDANNNNQWDVGETIFDSMSLNVYIGYAEIQTVNFTNDHGVLKTNWKQENGQWVKDDTYTYAGTVITSPEWDVNRKTNTGQYVSYGASYTKGSSVSVVAVFNIDSRGRAYHISGYGSNMNFADPYVTTLQGAVSWNVTSTSLLPSTVSTITSSISWTVGTATSVTSAGTSGNHTIYVTMGTPIQTYTTDNGTTYENTTTEKRLAWAINQTYGASTATGGTVSSPAGAAEKMVAAIGHNGASNMTTNWYAWGYQQSHLTIGDCGTMAALAVAGLGQIGVAAQHKLAYATSDSDATEMQYANFTYNGQVFRAKLVFTGNNYEGFFAVTDQGMTKAYTVYPKSGPYTNSNLHLDVLRNIVINCGLSQFWVWDKAQTKNGITVDDWAVVPGQGIVALPPL